MEKAMKDKYFLLENKKPLKGKPCWIFTYQEHINLAYYYTTKEGEDYFMNLENRFVDKHGECDVTYWCYADMPDFEECYDDEFGEESDYGK